MKKMACLVLIINCCWGLIACSTNQHRPLTKVAHQLEGNWINEEYLAALKLTQSPKQADEAARIKVVQIQKDTFKQLVLSFEEGDDWMLDRGEDGLFFSSIFDYKLQLKAKLISSQKLQLGNKFFLRYKEDLETRNKDLLLVQKTLFKGRYDWNGKMVEFFEDGSIHGMEREGIQTYYPIIYYNNDKEIDQIWLNKENDRAKKYGFEFKKKKLYIYQLDCPDQEILCGDKSQLGELLFELDKR